MNARLWTRLAVDHQSLEHAAELIRREAFAQPSNGRLQLELGIVEKLLGRIDSAFSLLERALVLLPREEREARQTAQFVLGLTWGDVGQPVRAVEAFEAADREDATSRSAQAARGYAAAYRDVHGLDESAA